MSPAALAERLRAIRYTQSAVARDIGLPINTVSRILIGSTDPILSNVEAIERALLAEERRLRDYLNRLPEAKHPAPADDWEAA